jgi:hypothetical protein
MSGQEESHPTANTVDEGQPTVVKADVTLESTTESNAASQDVTAMETEAPAADVTQGGDAVASQDVTAMETEAPTADPPSDLVETEPIKAETTEPATQGADALEKTPDTDKSDTMEATSNGATPAWDHSNRKVIVHNIMKFIDTKRMKKLVYEWFKQMKDKNPNLTIDFEKLRKPPKDAWVVITMKDEAMCQPFVNFINDNEILNKHGGKIAARQAGNELKRNGADDDDRPSKRARNAESAREARRPVTEEEIKDKIIPLWKLSEEDQKKKKLREMIKKCAMKIVSDVKTRFR